MGKGVASARQSIKIPLFNDPLVCVDQSPAQHINPRLSESKQPVLRALPTDFTVADTVNIETSYKFHNFADCLLTLNYQPQGGEGVIAVNKPFFHIDFLLPGYPCASSPLLTRYT